MAHEIEGNKAFFTNTPAWHGLGTVLNEAPSIKEAWTLAYPHTLIECPLEAFIIDGDGNRHAMPIETDKAIFRDDGLHIGNVGAGYHLQQPSEILEFFEPYIESGLVTLEAGGSLRGGTRMWALGKIKNALTDILPGDPVTSYLLAATAFDGTMAKEIKVCAERVVCANTLAIAQSEESALSFKIRHTKNMQSKINDAQAQIAQALNAHKESVAVYKQLATKQVNEAKMIAYIRDVIAPGKEEKDYSPQLVTKVNNVIDLLETQRGIELVPAIRGTAWQAYNAVTEYITHHASRTDDARVNNQWFDNATIGTNNRALALAAAM